MIVREAEVFAGALPCVCVGGRETLPVGCVRPSWHRCLVLTRRSWPLCHPPAELLSDLGVPLTPAAGAMHSAVM